MRKHEKELIAKIQISQLVADEPFVDDFYFQMYKLARESKEDTVAETNSKKGGKKSKKWLESSNQFIEKTSGAAISNQMQQQMKRLIESRRSNKPRESSVTLEGALGAIAKKGSKKPKQAIVVEPSENRVIPVTTTTSKIASLKAVEKLFSTVLKVEELNRKTIPTDEDELEQQYFFMFM
jgi:DNA topoisomerase 2-associated protein PAT1